ncbi:MAG: hypothetical protein WDW36_006679 [Sanguina aurantia]
MWGPKQKSRGDGFDANDALGAAFPGLRASRIGPQQQQQQQRGIGIDNDSDWFAASDMSSEGLSLRGGSDDGLAFGEGLMSSTSIELELLAGVIFELRKMEYTPPFKKVISILEQRAKAEKGIVGRAIRTHICRLNLMELIPEKSGDRRANLLVQETHVLQKLIDEEEHAGPLRCSAMRMLLAMAAKEIVKDTSSTSRPKVLSMLGSHVKRMQMGVQFGAMTSGPGHWVDPKEDWVVEHTQKLAFKVEKFEGATSKQRLEHRLQVMISTFQYAQQCAADASIRSLKDSCFVQEDSVAAAAASSAHKKNQQKLAEQRLAAQKNRSQVQQKQAQVMAYVKEQLQAFPEGTPEREDAFRQLTTCPQKSLDLLLIGGSAPKDLMDKEALAKLHGYMARLAAEGRRPAWLLPDHVNPLLAECHAAGNRTALLSYDGPVLTLQRLVEMGGRSSRDTEVGLQAPGSPPPQLEPCHRLPASYRSWEELYRALVGEIRVSCRVGPVSWGVLQLASR